MAGPCMTLWPLALQLHTLALQLQTLALQLQNLALHYRLESAHCFGLNAVAVAMANVALAKSRAIKFIGG
jgi:hypothetical protein